jgi:hypothetical protein
MQYCRSRAINQDPAQVRVTPFTDAKQLRLTTGRVLTGHDAEPGCELSPLAELGTVADGSDNGRGHDGAYAWYLANAHVLAFHRQLYLAIINLAIHLDLNLTSTLVKTAIGIQSRQLPLLKMPPTAALQ